MPFAGFPPETFAFLAELRDNNTRAWVDANRVDQRPQIEPEMPEGRKFR